MILCCLYGLPPFNVPDSPAGFLPVPSGRTIECRRKILPVIPGSGKVIRAIQQQLIVIGSKYPVLPDEEGVVGYAGKYAMQQSLQMAGMNLQMHSSI